MDNAQLLQSIEQMFVNMNTQFAHQLATVQETLTGQVEELRQEVTGRIDGLQHEVEGLRQEVGVLRQDVVEMQGQIADLQQGLTGLQEEVAGVKGEVAGLRLDITKLHETVQDNHAYTVSELSKVAKEVEDKVLVKARDDINTLKKEVEKYKDHVAAYSIDVNVVKSKINYCPCIPEELGEVRAKNTVKT